MKKNAWMLLTCVLLAAVSLFAGCEPVDGYWSKAYGTNDDYTYYQKILRTNDNGVLAYATCNQKLLMVRLDQEGMVKWSKTFAPMEDGLLKNFFNKKVIQSADGGFLALSQVHDADGKNSPLWVAKLDANGTIVWEYVYSGEQLTKIYPDNIRENPDTTIAVAASTGDGDFILLILDANGEVLSQTGYGYTAPSGDRFTRIYPCNDGGFVFHERMREDKTYIGRINNTGDIEWEKSYVFGRNILTGEYPYSEIQNIMQTSDGGYMVLLINSPYYLPSTGAIKLDSSGETVWAKEYDCYPSILPRVSFTGFKDVIENPDGSIAITGTVETWYIFGFAQMYLQSFRGLLMLLDADGGVQWSKVYKDNKLSDSDIMLGSIAAMDEGYAMAGEIGDIDTDPPNKFLMLKIDKDGGIPGSSLSIKNTIPLAKKLRVDAEPYSGLVAGSAELTRSSYSCVVEDNAYTVEDLMK